MRIAHRGDWRAAPENTLAAMRTALARPGCDGVEFDVRAASDDVPVLLHDETLARVQGVPAKVSDLSAAELSDHGVPSLATVLADVGREPFLIVELKEWVPAAVDVLELARGVSGRLHRAVVSSFESEVHRRFGRLRPAWQRWLNSVGLDHGVVEQALDLGCTGIAAQWASIDERAVDQTRAAGLELVAWTVRRRPTYQRLARLGVVAICAEAAALDG